MSKKRFIPKRVTDTSSDIKVMHFDGEKTMSVSERFKARNSQLENRKSKNWWEE